jgi:NAD(P)-dependent dehydrogenase (short-subunit alcohol dehydrogenase family)
MVEALNALPPLRSVCALHDLAGRVAVVTGAASGLGRAVAWGLACYGADVAILDKDSKLADACAQDIARGAGRRAFAVAADVSDEREIEQALDRVMGEFARVDVLINNAGHNIRKPLTEYSREEFDSLYAVHVRGAFLCSRALVRHMRDRRAGSIINIASILGHVGAENVAPYAAAKAALLQLTKVLALEEAPHGIRVNAIAPGYMDTPLTRQHAEQVRQRIIDTTPLGRFGQARELIGAALFLASDASSFVTGTSLIVDGGWTAR